MANIVVPQLGESVVEARVARWLKKEGDRVETGEPVVELETDKIDVEVGADHSGTLSSIKHGEGDDVKVGELLGTVDESGAAKAAEPAAKAAEPAAKVAEPAAKAAQPAAKSAPSEPPSGNGSATNAEPVAEPSRATPTARRIATDNKIDLEGVKGSGSAGRVTKSGVQKAVAPTGEGKIAPPVEAPVAPTSERAIAPTRESKSAPTSRPPRTLERSEERVRMSKRRQTI